MSRAKKPQILCVDDEPSLLEGLELRLRRHFKVGTATSGVAGLAFLGENPHTAVVLSDMRMPEMNGAEFLARVREAHPNTVRMLLTGQTDLESAIKAVNEGQLFRFLTKPCPPDQLLACFQGAIEQHNLIVAERELLAQTLRGSIKALLDVMALAHPAAFGRSVRIRDYVREMCEDAGVEDPWYVEVAAMMSQIGTMALDESTIAKLYHGQALSPEEELEVRRMPEHVKSVLQGIPRLEAVVEVVDDFYQAKESGKPARTDGGQMLLLAIDFDVLRSRGIETQGALDTLISRERYPDQLLAQFGRRRGLSASQAVVKELPLAQLKIGMVLGQDLYLQDGTLLVPRGFEITSGFVARVERFRAAGVRGPIRVILPAADPLEAPAQAATRGVPAPA